MRYCQFCGSQIADYANFCFHCGRQVGQQQQPPMNHNKQLIDTLCSRLKTSGAIWIVIAVLQILLGILDIWGLTIVGVLNIMSAITDIKNSQQYQTNPTGIVATYEPLVGPIIVLGYNLIFGGVIGVVGSIYYLTCVRGFVMENRSQFEAMDTTPQYTINR